MNEHKLLWGLQVVLGLYFIGVGISHYVVPEGLPAAMEWMYDLSDTLHVIAGTAEILCGIGLILPAATRIRPELTPLAAAGLVLVMVGAMVFHIGRSEVGNVATNVVLAALAGYVAYGRWRRVPIEAGG